MTKKPGLRERKFARTRLKLAQALVKRLQQASLEEIVVRDLCDDVEISEATFFNYFPRKLDLLDYYTQLWMLELKTVSSSTVQSSPATGRPLSIALAAVVTTGLIEALPVETVAGVKDVSTVNVAARFTMTRFDPSAVVAKAASASALIAAASALVISSSLSSASTM